MDLVGIYIQNHLIWKGWSDYFFVMYRPPDLSRFLYSKFIAVFRNLVSQLSLKDYILLGDCNVNFLKRSHNCKFKLILQVFGFTQLIHTLTKIANDAESLIDVIPFNTALLPRTPPSFPGAWLITNLLDASGNLISWLNNLSQGTFSGSLKKKPVTCRDYRFYDPTKVCPRLIGT